MPSLLAGQHALLCTSPAPMPPLGSCGGEVLLLKRTSKNNHGSWGLPGGNADDTDADLLEVATREAREEMGPELPRFQVVESVLTKRGKRWAVGGMAWGQGVGRRAQGGVWLLVSLLW